MYEKGYHDLKQNFELAYNHYSYACNHQIPEAFTHIGHMYKNVKAYVNLGPTREKRRSHGITIFFQRAEPIPEKFWETQRK